MNSPKVSVVMSTFNAGKYLRNAIDSILNQTFKNFEFIVINDGSTDQSEQILATHKDKRIKIIKNEKNIGLSKSLNIGIKQSRAKFIARMDSDDISLPERLSKQINFMNRHPEISVLGSAYYEMDERGHIKTLYQVFIEDAQIKRILSFNTIMAYIPHPTVMFLKDALLDVGLYNEGLKTTQDKDLFIRLAAKGYKFANLSEPLLKKRPTPIYNVNVHNQQRACISKLHKHRLSAFREKYRDLEIPSLPQSLRQLNQLEREAYARLYLRLGAHLKNFSQHNLAKEAFLMATICWSPSLFRKNK